MPFPDHQILSPLGPHTLLATKLCPADDTLFRLGDLGSSCSELRTLKLMELGRVLSPIAPKASIEAQWQYQHRRNREIWSHSSK